MMCGPDETGDKSQRVRLLCFIRFSLSIGPSPFFCDVLVVKTAGGASMYVSDAPTPRKTRRWLPLPRRSVLSRTAPRPPASRRAGGGGLPKGAAVPGTERDGCVQHLGFLRAFLQCEGESRSIGDGLRRCRFSDVRWTRTQTAARFCREMRRAQPPKISLSCVSAVVVGALRKCACTMTSIILTALSPTDHNRRLLPLLLHTERRS